MKVLVTGAGGMLGRIFCQQLKDKNEIYGIDIRPGFTEIDITEKQALWDFVKKAQPQVIVHTAACTDVDGCELNPKKAYEVNAEGTKNLASACNVVNALIVYISTDYVFDGEKRSAYIESDKPNPVNIYGKSKLRGEEYTKEICKNFLIVRSSGLFGKNGKNFVDAILKNAQSSEKLKVVDEQYNCPTYVDDLAAAVINLIYKKKSGIYHITNNGICSWYEFAKEILKTTGIRKEVIPIKSEECGRLAKRPKMSALSCDKYTEDIGKTMRHWKEALEGYLNG